MMKKLFTIILAVMMSVLMAMPAFAGAWKTGTGSNQNMWWYDNEDGTYAAGRCV